MESQQWTKARQVSIKAINLEPFSAHAALRLSTSYEMEEDYTMALEWLQHAMSLLHPSERVSYRHRSEELRHRSVGDGERLTEQQTGRPADFERQVEPLRSNHVRQLRPQPERNEIRAVPGDLLSRLPLELIITISKFGLADDRHFVLRLSWVCKTWRAILVNQCPELWGCLSLSWDELRTNDFRTKHEAWITRSQGRFHMIDFWCENLSVIAKIPKAYTPYMAATKRLRLDVLDSTILGRFCKRFQGLFHAVESLHINSYRGQYGVWLAASTVASLHCGLLGGQSLQSLREMVIQNVDCFDWHNMDRGKDGHFNGRCSTIPPAREIYPRLTSLTVSNAFFDVFEADLEDNEDGSVASRRTSCVLHRTLSSAASALENLKVICPPGMAAPPGSLEPITATPRGMMRPQRVSKKRIQLPHLRTIVIPPPAVWAIDMLAPKVESLDFVLSGLSTRGWYERRPIEARAPLIPNIHDSPLDVNDFTRLTSLGLSFCSTDTAPSLQAWLSRVTNITKLTLRGSRQEPAALDDSQDEPLVNMCVGQVLLQDPAWVPSLTELDLINCDVPDNLLFDYVKLRRESVTLSPLSKLVVRNRSSTQMSAETRAWLQEAVGEGFVTHDFCQL
jgi:hypothetical protein